MPAYTLVTGAAGFLGSRLALALGPQEHLALVDEFPRYRHRECCQQLLSGNRIRRFTIAQLGNLLADLPISRVFHLGSVRVGSPELMTEYNTNCSQRLWDWCVEQRVPFYYTSSAATYGDGKLGYDDDPELLPRLRPWSHYGFTKHAFDLYVAEEVARGYTPPHWAGWKLFEVYGPGEAHKSQNASLPWRALSQIRVERPITLWQSDKAQDLSYNWLYIGDVIDVLLRFSRSSYPSGIYNLGCADAISGPQLVAAIEELLGQDCPILWRPLPKFWKGRFPRVPCANLRRLKVTGLPLRWTPLARGLAATWASHSSLASNCRTTS